MSIQYMDPDSDDENPTVRPAWSKPKDDVDGLALRTCGRQYFKSPKERKEWRALRDKTLGANIDDILYDAWIKHNIEYCAGQNQRFTKFNFTILIKMIQNDQRRVDWFAANREKVMKSRKAAAIGAVSDSFFSEE